MENLNQETEVTLERIPTGIVGATEADDIFISTRALEKIIEIRNQNNVPENYFLRMAVQGGGCSGFNYALGFDSEYDPLNDMETNIHGLRIVIDRRSLFYLMGVTLDFIDNSQGRGFVFSNPNNLPTCGCQG
ncbi:MAG: HesB/IscA family protein [Candidatus Kapaibacteriota bacterium]